MCGGDSTVRNRARTFSTRRDARDFDAEVRRQRRAGSLAAIDAGAETLGEYVTGTWATSHAATLAAKTRLHYASLYDHHLRPYLASIALREMTPEVIGRWQADQLGSGAGPIALRHAMDLLGSILEHAFVGGHLSANPARRVKKARAPRREEVQPLAPGTIEAMRAALDTRDATLISVLAYAGLRPGEALGLRWGDVREQTLLIQRAISLGEESDTKTRQHRTVPSSRRLPRICGPGAWPPAGPPIPSWCSPARKDSPGRRLVTSRGAGGRSIGRQGQPAWRTRAHTTCATALLRSSCTRDAVSSTWRVSSVTTHA